MKAYIFPGMGAQKVGMGKELYDNNPEAREMFERVNDTLGFRLSDIMFYGPEEALDETDVMITAVNAYAMIVTRFMDGFKPDAIIGYSSGEFASFGASRAIDVEDAIFRINRYAKKLMAFAKTTDSKMSVVMGLSDAEVENVCSEVGDVWVANRNFTGHVVISGTRSAVKIANKKLREAGASRAMMLPFEGGFHSPIMAPVYDNTVELYAGCAFKTPICPVYSAVKAVPTMEPKEFVEMSYLHHTDGARFRDCIRHALDHGITEFEEIGAVSVLTPFVRRIRKEWEEEKCNSK